MPQQKIIDRIRKLLAVSQDESATPEEAASFAAKASQLLIEHGLDEDSVTEAASSVGQLVWKAPYAGELWFRNLVAAAAPNFMCSLYLTKYQTIIKSRKTPATKLVSKTAFVLVGTPERTSVMQDVCQYLFDSIVRMARAYSPKRAEQLAFIRGASLAVSYRFSRAVADRREAAFSSMSDSPESRSLVLVESALSEVEEYMAGLGLREGRKTRAMKTGSGFSAGYSAGEKMNIGVQIESSPQGEIS